MFQTDAVIDFAAAGRTRDAKQRLAEQYPTTYDEFDLDDQPDVGRPDRVPVVRLETQPEHARWNIDDSDATPQRRGHDGSAGPK